MSLTVDEARRSDPSRSILPAAPLDLAIHRFGGQSGEMVISMELGFDGRLNTDLLAQAVDLLLDAEPVLGCRLVLDEPKPHWRVVPQAERRRLVVTYAPDEYEEIRRTGLNATANVQVVFCLWRADGGDRLLIKMTHEAGDGVGLQLLTTRLASIYSELCADPKYRPLTNHWWNRDVAQVLSSVPILAYPQIVWQFAKFAVPRFFPRHTHALPLPHESIGPWAPVIKRLLPPQVARLSAYGKMRGATLNDMFLAAAYRALAEYGKWDGSSALRISMTVDLRRWCPGAGARSICNLSSFEYPFLVRNLGQTFDQTLGNVASLTRRRKENWPGLVPGLIGRMLMKRYSRRGVRHGAAEKRRRERERPQRPLTLSNEGRLDKPRLRFGSHAPAFAYILPPFLALPYVHICMTGYEGAITLAAVTPQNGYAVVDGFLNALVEQLPGAQGVAHSTVVRPRLVGAFSDVIGDPSD